MAVIFSFVAVKLVRVVRPARFTRDNERRGLLFLPPAPAPVRLHAGRFLQSGGDDDGDDGIQPIAPPARAGVVAGRGGEVVAGAVGIEHPEPPNPQRTPGPGRTAEPVRVRRTRD